MQCRTCWKYGRIQNNLDTEILERKFAAQEIEGYFTLWISQRSFYRKKKFHGGLDLHARGEKVMAMMAGIVVKVGQDNASGKYVVLRHGNYQVSYCHLSRILVETGRKVCPAEPVGITGSTGRSTGEHLHITCKLNGRLVNPWMLIRHISSIREECVEALVRLEQTVNAISGTSL